MDIYGHWLLIWCELITRWRRFLSRSWCGRIRSSSRHRRRGSCTRITPGFSPALLPQYDLHNARLVVLKPGYALLTLTNALRVIPNLDEVTTWQYKDQIVKMKRSTDSDIPIRSTSPGCTRNRP